MSTKYRNLQDKQSLWDKYSCSESCRVNMYKYSLPSLLGSMQDNVKSVDHLLTMKVILVVSVVRTANQKDVKTWDGPTCGEREDG